MSRARLVGGGLALAWLAAPLGAQAPESALTPVDAPRLESREAYQRDRHRDLRATPEVGMGDVEGAVERVMLDRTRIGTFAYVQGHRLQPALRLGGRARGIRSAWDGAETCPPQALKVGAQWEPEGGARDLGYRGFGDLDDPEHRLHWQRRGAAFYHDLLEVQGARRSLLHRFLFFFPWGHGDFGGHLGPHAVWVELRQRLDPDEAERGRWVARARRDLERQRDQLRRLVQAPEGEAAPARPLLARIDELLAGEVEPPLHMSIDRVIVSDPTPVRGGTPWALRVYQPEQLGFDQDRVILYVTEGTHRFLASPAELGRLEECDPPYLLEPGGRLPLIDLRTFEHPENPLAARARGEKVPLLPGFLDTPVLVFGFQEASWRFPDRFQGRPFGAPPPRPAAPQPSSASIQPASTATAEP